MTDRKKPSAAFWATVVVVVPLLYVLDFGPACWITSRVGSGEQLMSAIYEPLFESSALIRPGLHAYALFGAAKGWHWRKVSGGWTGIPNPGAP
jgi:hypothetical protein